MPAPYADKGIGNVATNSSSATGLSRAYQESCKVSASESGDGSTMVAQLATASQDAGPTRPETFQQRGKFS